MNRKKKEEIIKNFTVVLYPSTMDEYLKLKEQNKWTHDEAIKELVRFYKGGNKMTTATAEKPTCQYNEVNGYVRTGCGQYEFADVVKDYNYCPDCGRKVERE